MNNNTAFFKAAVLNKNLQLKKSKRQSDVPDCGPDMDMDMDMDMVKLASQVMYKNNHGIFLAQAVSQILTEIKLHQQLVHRELGMTFKPFEPGH